MSDHPQIDRIHEISAQIHGRPSEDFRRGVFAEACKDLGFKGDAATPELMDKAVEIAERELAQHSHVM